MSIPSETVAELVSGVLESLAYADVTVDSAPFDWSQPGLAWAEIRLDAPRSDHMTLALAEPLAGQLVDDALGGVPPELIAAAIPDFMGELSNTLAGVLLARLHPGEPIVLGLPETGRGPRAVPAGQTYTFDVEGLSLGVTLRAA